MRRVLVPLDGSEFAEAIIPDARLLAGIDGELILVREASWPILQRDIFVDTSMLAVEDAEWYLEHEAERLRADGVSVRTQSLILANAAAAIDSAVKIFNADMIAIATHGRGPSGRLAHGSTAWRALAHSTVPVLLRHIESGIPPGDGAGEKRRVMVPLDGSTYAEKALPVAQELALEWNAPLWLVQVVLDIPVVGSPYARMTPVTIVDEKAISDVHAYLQKLADSLLGEVHIQAAHGRVVDTLIEYVDQFSITDVVMASHGRTGLSRVILGSVADDLLQRLHIPIIVIPVLATGRLEEQPGSDRPYAAAVTASSEQGAS